MKEPWDDIEEEVYKKVSLNHASSSRQLQLKSTGDEAFIKFPLKSLNYWFKAGTNASQMVTADNRLQ